MKSLDWLRKGNHSNQIKMIFLAIDSCHTADFDSISTAAACTSTSLGTGADYHLPNVYETSNPNSTGGLLRLQVFASVQHRQCCTPDTHSSSTQENTQARLCRKPACRAARRARLLRDVDERVRAGVHADQSPD